MQKSNVVDVYSTSVSTNTKERGAHWSCGGLVCADFARGDRVAGGERRCEDRKARNRLRRRKKSKADAAVRGREVIGYTTGWRTDRNERTHAQPGIGDFWGVIRRARGTTTHRQRKIVLHALLYFLFFHFGRQKGGIVRYARPGELQRHIPVCARLST